VKCEKEKMSRYRPDIQIQMSTADEVMCLMARWDELDLMEVHLQRLQQLMDSHRAIRTALTVGSHGDRLLALQTASAILKGN
jgi:hypothetical protein